MDDARLDTALQLCVKRRAILLVDPPSDWVSVDKAEEGAKSPPVVGVDAWNAAIYFPLDYVRSHPGGPLGDVRAIRSGSRGDCPHRRHPRACGKRPPAKRHVERSGRAESAADDAENGELNPLGHQLPAPAAGRRLCRVGRPHHRGDDRLASQWKYIPVRRTALFIEESRYRGTQWAVFEPNDEPLWAQLRLNIGVFMHKAVPPGRIPRPVASGGLLCQVRQQYHHPGRRRSRHCQRRGWLCPVETSRVCCFVHPANGWTAAV